MGSCSLLLLACAGRRTVIGPTRVLLLLRPVRSRGRRQQYLHSGSGAWNRTAGENLISVLKPATDRWQHKATIYGILGVSAIVYWGESQRIEAEEVHHSCPPGSAASALDQATEVQLQGQALQESDTAEVPSNVHTAKWRVFTDMGRDLFSKGRLDESEKYLVQALEEAKQGFGEKDAHVASSCNNLAELYRMKRDYEKAEALFLKAVEILETSFNPNHVSVSVTLHNLGGTYLVQRKFDQARHCYERSLEIKEKELGRNHPEFSNTMFHLGELLRLEGQFTEAQKLIQESINILQEDGVGTSQVAIRRMGRLVEILSQTGQLKEAEKLQRKILHHLELTQGPESSNATTAAENLAGTLQAVGKLEEAGELLQRSFEVRQKALPPTHIQIGVTMFKLASVSIQKGDELVAKKTDKAKADAKLEYELAEALLRRAIRIAERSQKPVSGAQVSVAMRAGPLISLLRSLDALGHLEMKKLELATSAKEVEVGKKEAEKLFRHCLSVLEKPGVSQDLSSIPEFQRQHVVCLRHLAMLLNSAPDIKATSAQRAEADQLLRKADHIETDFRKHKMKMS